MVFENAYPIRETLLGVLKSHPFSKNNNYARNPLGEDGDQSGGKTSW